MRRAPRFSLFNTTSSRMVDGAVLLNLVAPVHAINRGDAQEKLFQGMLAPLVPGSSPAPLKAMTTVARHGHA
jgi:hypothetical protein